MGGTHFAIGFMWAFAVGLGGCAVTYVVLGWDGTLAWALPVGLALGPALLVGCALVVRAATVRPLRR